MIEFGKTLREAREAKGLTINQLANATNLMHQIVADLEEENFSRIAAPIYGRGFVKLYCEAVGLDPKPLIAEYMAILNGDREVAIHVRPRPATPPPPPPPPPPAPEPEPQPRVVSLFDEPQPEPQQPRPVAAPVFESKPAPVFAPKPPAPVYAPEPEPTPAEVPLAAPRKRLAPLRPPSPLPDPKSAQMPSLPSNTWRVLLVAGVAIAVLWVAALGVKALYRATMTPPDQPADAAEAPKIEAPAPVVETPQTGPRTPIEIPPLYID